MTTGIPDSLERLSHTDLIGVVRELIGEVGRLRTENEKLSGALTKLKVEHQAVRDELARLKNLPPRPPQKPSGMDKATDRGVSGGAGAKSPAGDKSSRRRGSQLDKLTIDATVVVRAKAPAGSRHKGYEEIVVQDLNLSPQVTLYCRERWETPEGERIIAALDPGIVGGYGPNLHRFVLALHFSGQVTCERIVALLNGMGVLISKRQVVRLLTAKLETFRAEDEAVLKAGLGGAYVTVDDTGARHAGKSGYTTQIGSDTFTVFRTGPSKSRLAFLSRLCGGTTLYVINDAALDYMKDRQLPQVAIGKFADHKERIFSRPEDWERHLQALDLTDLDVTPDPVLIASEGALWGAIRHQGLLPDTVIVSDDAGQFRVGIHALCWVHAERLVHKLVPANDKQRNAIEVAKRMIWWFYGSLKEYKLAPSPQQAKRYFAKQLLSMPVEVLFDGIRSGAAVGDLLAEPNHRAVGVIERQLFSAGNTKAMVPSAGMAIRARDHQAMQYREIDRSLDVEAEPSTDKQGTDHLGTAGLPPQPTEHKIRADADPPQLGKLAAIEARQHDRAPRMPRCRCHQRIQHPGRLDLVPTSQRFDHALHVPPALAGVLDEIEILVGVSDIWNDKPPASALMLRWTASFTIFCTRTANV